MTVLLGQDFESNEELKFRVIGFLEEVIHDPELLTQERKAAANIIRCGAGLSAATSRSHRGQELARGVEDGLGPGEPRRRTGTVGCVRPPGTSGPDRGHGRGVTPTLVPTCGAGCDLQ